MVHSRVAALAIARTIHLACLHGGHRPLHHGDSIGVIRHVLRIDHCALLKFEHLALNVL
jgi:hypothetical protein